MRRHRPVQSGTVDLSIRGHFVYRLYATDGRLLYVGLSSNVLARIGRHLSSAPWGAEIARIEWDEWPTRYVAETAEAQQILRLKPLHNMAGEWSVIPLGPVPFDDLPDVERDRQAVGAHRRLALGDRL